MTTCLLHNIFREELKSYDNRIPRIEQRLKTLRKEVANSVITEHNAARDKNANEQQIYDKRQIDKRKIKNFEIELAQQKFQQKYHSYIAIAFEVASYATIRALIISKVDTDLLAIAIILLPFFAVALAKPAIMIAAHYLARPTPNSSPPHTV